ncbi:MAG: hypothetical protein ABI418_00665 [Jatrophihabitantaceae bacterium]
MSRSCGAADVVERLRKAARAPAASADFVLRADESLKLAVELGIPGTQLINTGADERPLIATIVTEADSPLERLRAG